MDQLDHSLVSTILALGVLQGVIMSALLFWSPNNRKSNQYLALAILCLAAALFRAWTHMTGLWWTHFFRRLPLSLDLAMMPLMYLYALSITHSTQERIHKARWLLLPWLVFFIYSVVVYLAAWPAVSLDGKDLIAGRWRFGMVKAIEDTITVVLNIILAIGSWRVIKSYEGRITEWISDKLSSNLRLLSIIVALSILGMVLSAVDFSATYIFDQGSEEHWLRQLFFVFGVVVIYAIGFIGYRMNEVPRFDLDDTTTSAYQPDSNGTLDSFNQIELIMSETQLFLNPDLNLNQLADQVGLTSVETSKVIKAHTRKNFRAFINDYRIDLVKSRLLDPDYNHLSIIAIAFDAGFNSEPSFYRYFKQVAGMSPSEFRQSKS